MAEPDQTASGDRLVTRRGLLRSLTVAGVAGLAGCGGGESESRTGSRMPTDRTSPTHSPPTATREQARRSRTPDSPAEDLRTQVAEVGTDVRPAVVLFDTDGLPTEVAGVFLEPSLIVTAASALGSTAPTVRTVDGRTHEATLLDRTSPADNGDDDIAALRVDGAEPTLSAGSAAALSQGDILIHVGHHRKVGAWLVQFGRLRGRTPDGERLTTYFPVPTPGGPVVTRSGALVGVVAGSVGTEPPAAEVPPPTESPRVYTERRQWEEAQFEPLSDVRARVTAWTE